VFGDHIHARGSRCGIYSDAGTSTCDGRHCNNPGMLAVGNGGLTDIRNRADFAL